ncbi:MAG: hypothetical protein U0804_17685 [Gemmataceae bacterium]
MPARISCPAGGSQVAVIGQTTGTPGKICVHGTYIDEKDSEQVRVRVQPRGQAADPSTGTDTDVIGQRWCARNVPVPTCAAGGTELTVFVWTIQIASGGTTYRLDDQQNFIGVPGPASGLDDCCAGCGSGSMMAPQFAQAAATLSAGKGVRVTVPDGPDAGHHSAGPTAQLTWQARVGKAVCEVKLCPTDGLLVRVDGKPVEATDVQYEPVSALLPGAAFGSRGPVLVSQA